MMSKMLSSMRKLPKKYIIFAGIALVVIGASGAMAFYLSQQQSMVGNNGSAGQNNGSSTTDTSATSPVETKAKEADKLAYEGNVDAGVKVLDQAISNTTVDSEKATYYSQKATLLYNDKKLDTAISDAIKAFELEKNSGNAAFVGQIALEKGDKATALKYYQLAIDLIDKESPVWNEDVAYYQSVIKDIESSK
jgi:tetratricopeptide (TPR) repeat protein